MTNEMAAQLALVFRTNLSETSGETLTRVEVKEMADGSGNWGLFAECYDVAGEEFLYRTVVNPDGEVVGSENELIPQPSSRRSH